MDSSDYETVSLLTFHPETKEWTEAPIQVKIEPEPFAKGAMRGAYKMYQKGPNDEIINWVAKKYFSHEFENGQTAEDVYKNDVIVQEVSRHYAKLYNEEAPPKLVNIVPAFMIRCINRPDKDIYCIESLIEGEYFKHNTNSGALLRESGQWRNTPHAFSHFTFEKSKHTLIIVDIQGVGDMYTDPQIHTNERNNITQYGTGNLGIRGMALFLYTHQCSPVCKHLGLQEFMLFDDTVVQQVPPLWRTSTVTSKGFSDIIRRSKLASSERHVEITRSMKALKPRKKPEGISESPTEQSSSPSTQAALGLRHTPKVSKAAAQSKHVVLPIQYYKGEMPMVCSTRSFIHYELAKLHTVGRLSQIDKVNYEEAVKAGMEEAEEWEATPDSQASFYHFQKAGQGGCVEALLALARIHSPVQLVLPDASQEDPTLVFKYLTLASERGSKEATYWAAEHATKSEDHVLAAACLQRLIDNTEKWYPVVEEELYHWELKAPSYELKASLAKLLGDGEFGLAQDIEKATELYNEAAEEATAAKKGKLAMQYYEAVEYLG